MTVRLGGALSDFVSANVSENGGAKLDHGSAALLAVRAG
jgi:hypothetical protein